MTQKQKEKEGKLRKAVPRGKGKKGEVLFDTIDFGILSNAQHQFMTAEELAKQLNLTTKNIYPHIKKLVKVSLLDGVKDTQTGIWNFTSHFKMFGTKNDWNFTPNTDNAFNFLERLYGLYIEENFNKDIDNLVSEGKPKI